MSISDIKWENNNTVSFTKPLLTEYTEKNIEEWVEAGKQTTTIDLQINGYKAKSSFYPLPSDK